MKALLLAGALFLATLPSTAQVKGYNFHHEQGQYTSVTDPIYSGATITTHRVQDDLVTPYKIAIPFPFKFGGRLMDSINIHGNGFLWFGNADWLMLTAKWPISTVHSSRVTGIVSAFGLDLHPQLPGSALSSTVRSAVVGRAPMRMLIVEWENFSREETINTRDADTLNFQIRLYESSDRVELLYGNCYLNQNVVTEGEVGIRGSDYNDYSNRVMNGSWSTSSAGNNQTSRVMISRSNKPDFGQLLVWEFWEQPTSIRKPIRNETVAIFPNPASNTLHLSLKDVSMRGAKWSIYDMTGRAVSSGSASHEETDIPISNLANGQYILELKNNGQVARKRFTKASL